MSGPNLYRELLPLLDSPSADPVRERPVESGRRAWSFCPVHADGSKYGKRSLSLDPKYGLTCFAGCEFRDIMQALRGRSGFHPIHQSPTAPYRRNGKSSAHPGGRIVASWVYQDEQGEPLFRVIRKEWPGGGKEFPQQHPDGNGGWAWGRGGARYVLYRLPQLLDADPQAAVFLVEGEGCADALTALGLVATTAPEGAKATWRPDYTEALRGRRIVILPDRDKAGEAHAEKAGKALLGEAAEVRFVVLPGLPFKGDVVDWLAAGGTVDALMKLVELAPIARTPSEMFPKAVDTRVLDASGVA